MSIRIFDRGSCYNTICSNLYQGNQNGLIKLLNCFSWNYITVKVYSNGNTLSHTTRQVTLTKQNFHYRKTSIVLISPTKILYRQTVISLLTEKGSEALV